MLLKKMWGLAGSIILTAGLLAGCGSEQQNVPDTGANVPQERVTLKVGIFDRGNSPSGVTVTNNYWTNWVKDSFGAVESYIDVEFVPIPRSGATEKVNVMMASEDAPDIVFASTDNLLPYNFAKQGGLMDLTDIIDEHGPNLKSYLGDVLEMGKVDGKIYSIPGKRVYQGRYTSIIRQDWLDELNLQMPATTEETYEVLKAIKAAKPDAIPLGFALRQSSIEPIMWSFVEPLNEEQRYTLTQQLGATDFPVLLPGFKAGLKFLNQMYNEGLMSPDFALDTDGNQLNEDIMNGKVGLYSEDTGKTYNSTPGIAAKLIASEPAANLVPVDPYTNSEGKHAKPGYLPNNFYIMVPAKSERALEAVKYLNWLASEEVMSTILNGTEGQDYTLVDGVPQRIDSQEVADRMYNAGDIELMTSAVDYGNAEMNRKAMVSSVAEQFRARAEKSYEIGETDTLDQIRFPDPIEAEIKYGAILGDLYNEMLVKVVMASPQDFEATYQSMMDQYMKSGGQQILDERIQAYAALK